MYFYGWKRIFAKHILLIVLLECINYIKFFLTELLTVSSECGALAHILVTEQGHFHTHSAKFPVSWPKHCVTCHCHVTTIALRRTLFNNKLWERWRVEKFHECPEFKYNIILCRSEPVTKITYICLHCTS